MQDPLTGTVLVDIVSQYIYIFYIEDIYIFYIVDLLYVSGIFVCSLC